MKRACSENFEGDTSCAIADSFPFAVLMTFLPALVLVVAALLRDWFWRVVGCVLALQVAAFFVVFSLP
jgi:hypothetical protein